MHDLRGKVLGGTTQSEGLVQSLSILGVRELFSESKINHLDVALAVNQQILGLKIAVSDIFGMQVD